MEVLDSITNKVGPLPAWAWAAIPAAGYVAWSYYKAAQGEGVIADDSTGGAEGTSAEDYGLNTGGTFLPGYGSAPGGSSNLPAVDTPQFNNSAWFKQAMNFLIGEGVPAMDAVTALNAYIYGFPTEITQTQFNALQKAITKIGAAPDGGFIPTVKVGTTAPPATGVKVPEAPTTVSIALPNATTANVKWGRPAVTGGSAIIGYKAELWTLNPTTNKWGVAASKLTLASTFGVNFSVTRNRYYLAAVTARNVKGYGPAGKSQTIRTPK